LRDAADHFRAGVELRYAAHVRAGQECLIGLALTYQAQGRHAEAQSVVSILSDYHRELVNPQLNAEGRSLQARLAVLNGDMLTARNWIGGESSESGLVFGWCEVPSVTRLRLELADSTGGDLGRARREVDRLLEQVGRLHQPRRQTELLTLKALICDRQGERAEAVIRLKAALAIAEPRGLIRSIVDAGPQVLPLLRIIKREAATPYIERLLAALQPLDNSLVDDTRASNQPEVILTRREREVLTLLGQHQTDREIAATLVISTLTVRTHIEHLAEKFGVRGRRAIVTRAREIGLLT
jgi:LuxR family maltose regulon positive regulatory protein